MKKLIIAGLLAFTAGTVAAQDPAQAPAMPAAMDGDPLPMDHIVAVVGRHPILWSDVWEGVNQMQAQGQQIPTDSAGQMLLARQVLQRLIDEELIVQQARQQEIVVTDADVSNQVEAHVKRVREQFGSEEAMRTELQTSGFGTIEEWRRWVTEQQKRSMAQQRLFAKLREDGKFPPAPVTEAEVQRFFDENRGQVPRLPPTVHFDQVIVAPRASEGARLAAIAKAESLLVEIRRGGDFEAIAKRESQDGTREMGGDLGWRRRGDFVPEFERVAFSLPPGRVSGVVETSFGFHIIKVDRVQPGEVKVRHVLIRPELEAANAEEARQRADSAAAMWRRGVSHDSLVARFHDPAEERGTPQPFPREQLPQPYQTGFEGSSVGDVVIFPLPDPARGQPKYVVARVKAMEEARDASLRDFREQIRENLQQDRTVRRYLEQLRRGSYVSVRL